MNQNVYMSKMEKKVKKEIKVKIEGENEKKINLDLDLVHTNIYYIHFKNERGATPDSYPPINLAGWTYQNQKCGVVHSIATTFRSNVPVDYPTAVAAFVQVRNAFPNVRRVLLTAHILDWCIEDGEEEISALGSLLNNLCLDPEVKDESDTD